MTRQHAKTTVAAPLAVVQERLAGRRPAGRPSCPGSSSAEPAGFERWQFTLAERLAPPHGARRACRRTRPSTASRGTPCRARATSGEFRLKRGRRRAHRGRADHDGRPAGPPARASARCSASATHTAQLDLQRLDAFVTAEHAA